MAAAVRQVYIPDPGSTHGDTSPLVFNVSAMPLGNVLSGSALFCAGTCSNFAGTFVFGWDDTQNGAYTKLDNPVDAGNCSFVSFVKTTSAALSGSDVMRLHYGTGSPPIDGFEDFQNAVIFEITGVTSMLDHKGNLQTVASTTTDAITSGNLVCGNNPGIIIAFSLNCTGQDTAGPTPWTTVPGANFSDDGIGFLWGLPAGQQILRVAHYRAGNLGTIPATFTASHTTSDNYQTLAAAFLETTSPQILLGQACL